MILEAYLPIKDVELPNEVVERWSKKLKLKFDRIVEGLYRRFFSGIDIETLKPSTPEGLYIKYVVERAYEEYKMFVNTADKYRGTPELFKAKLASASDVYLESIKSLANKREYFESRVDEAKSEYLSKTSVIAQFGGYHKYKISTSLKATCLLAKSLYVKKFIEQDDVLLPRFWLINVFGFNVSKYKLRFFTTLSSILSLLLLSQQIGNDPAPVIDVLHDFSSSFLATYSIRKYTPSLDIIYDEPTNRYILYVKVIVNF